MIVRSILQNARRATEMPRYGIVIAVCHAKSPWRLERQSLQLKRSTPRHLDRA
jgi:hypothetical protein